MYFKLNANLDMVLNLFLKWFSYLIRWTWANLIRGNCLLIQIAIKFWARFVKCSTILLISRTLSNMLVAHQKQSSYCFKCLSVNIIWGVIPSPGDSIPPVVRFFREKYRQIVCVWYSSNLIPIKIRAPLNFAPLIFAHPYFTVNLPFSIHSWHLISL